MENYFNNHTVNPNGIFNLSPMEGYQICQDGAILVDVREEYLNRHKIFDVPELIFCPKKRLAECIAEFPAGKTLIIADASGIHSPEAVKILIELGFKGTIANLSGGLVDWEHSGLPVIINYNERIPGRLLSRDNTKL